jgi:hypothetical protein
MEKILSAGDIRKSLQRIYLDMKQGKTYEDKACKETYILNSMLRAIELSSLEKKADQNTGNGDSSNNQLVTP